MLCKRGRAHAPPIPAASIVSEVPGRAPCAWHHAVTPLQPRAGTSSVGTAFKNGSPTSRNAHSAASRWRRRLRSACMSFHERVRDAARCATHDSTRLGAIPCRMWRMIHEAACACFRVLQGTRFPSKIPGAHTACMCMSRAHKPAHVVHGDTYTARHVCGVLVSCALYMYSCCVGSVAPRNSTRNSSQK